MLQAPTIFIPIESKKREFDGKVLLASKLISKGWKVVIGTKPGIQRELLHNTNALYLAKSVSADFIPFYKRASKLNHSMVALDVEGGALTKVIKNDLLRSYQEKAMLYFDYIYVFGDKIKNDIVEHLPYIPAKNIVVTGEPRFDLLKSSHNLYYSKEMDEIKNKYGVFVLINTSFGLTNSVLGEEWIKSFLETTKDIPDEQRHLYLLKHELGKQLIPRFINMTIKLANNFPNLNFVLRPHPDEKHSMYKTSFQGVSNVFVDGAGSVHPWIKAALAVIHHDCTTGLESVMAGKPTISFAPSTNNEITAWLPIFASIHCKDENQVLEVIRDTLACSEIKYSPGEEKEKVIASYFVNYLHDSTTLLADHLTKHYWHKIKKSHNSIWLNYMRLKSRINIIRLEKANKKRGWDKFIRLKKKELKAKLYLTGNLINGKKVNIKIKGGNAAYIEQKK